MFVHGGGSVRTGDLHHPLGCHCVDPVARHALHRVHAGEGAEGRQHAQAGQEVEARQAQPVVGAAAEGDAGVQVTGEHRGAGNRPRVVAQPQSAERQGFIHGVNAQIGRRVAGMVVVVAAHQRQLERRMSFPPMPHRLQRAGRHRTRGVQQVTEENDPARGR